jgi:HlyD family secretion protein
VALTALLQAEAQLAAVAVRLAQTRIVAPKDGVVLTRAVEPGDVVQPSRTLLVLAADAEGAQIVFQSDERNLASIRIGQKARVSADAYPQQVFDAEVSYIAPSIDPERGSVEVRLRAASAPDHLKPDMTVSIDLTVAVKKQALTLPSDVVRGAASPAPWLLAVEGGRVVRADVGLGIRGDGAIEIASDFKEGTDVIVPDGQLLTAGQRVRATREER